jgi:hypothetical protein
VLLLGGKKGRSSPAVLVETNATDMQGRVLDPFAPNYDYGWRMESASLEGAGDFEPDPILVLHARITCIDPDLADDIIAMFR